MENVQKNESLEKLIEEKRQKALELKKRRQEERMKQSLNINNLKELKAPKISSNLNLVIGNKNNVEIRQNLTKKNNFTQIRPNIFEKNTTIQSQRIDFTQNHNISSTNVEKIIKLSFILENAYRFSVKVDYNSEILKIFHSLDNKRYDPQKKIWSFMIKSYSEMLTKLKSLGIKIEFGNLFPESTVKALMNAEKNNKINIDLSERLENDFINLLYSYQRDGIVFGIKRDGKCLIADDMGLGKTVQAIGLAKWFREDWPLIIVCPASLREQWKQSFLRWVPKLLAEDIFIVENCKNEFPNVLITITSYDLITRMRNIFTIEKNRFYKMIILDESHYIKSDFSKRTSTVALIAKNCNRVVLLSGTPVLSKPIELFCQLNIIDSDLFPSKHGFGVRYCNAFQKKFFKQGKGPVLVWDYTGANNLEEFKILLESTLMIRRLKKSVLNELPSKSREMIYLSNKTDANWQKYFEKFKNLNKSRKFQFSDTSPIFSLFAKSVKAKSPVVKEYLSDLLESDIKFICFCHHQTMMDDIETVLNEKKINHIRIDGTTLPSLRQTACDVFQKNESYRVALLSITACATGLNLTAASLVVFAEVFWNPGVLAQAEDRVHRIGQKHHVRVIYLIAKGTIDEIIWPIISKKLEILNKAGLSNDNMNLDPLKIEDQQLITDFFDVLNHESNIQEII